MLNLYTFSPAFHLFFLFLGLCGLLGESFLCYFRFPLRLYRKPALRFLEGSCLVLLLVLVYALYCNLELASDGLYPVHALDTLRFGACVLLLSSEAAAFSRLSPGERILLLCAGTAGLPFWDRYSPWNFLVPFFLLCVRAFYLLPRALRENHSQISARSILEALNTLETGILICEEKGTSILLNLSMLLFMETVLGSPVLNGNIFWHLMQNYKGQCRRQPSGKNWLFTLPDGRRMLLQRESIRLNGKPAWQITAGDVTAAVRTGEKLAEQNAKLRVENKNLKNLLQHVQEIQSRETIAEIRFRIHDLMGQRISLLQQVLNNKNLQDYSRVVPLVANMLKEVREDITLSPQVVLAELAAVYRRLGVGVIIRGTLPRDFQKADSAVKIIREALTNGVVHGRASQIAISFKENGFTVQDNGIGCPGPVQEGGGLSGIRRRLSQTGGSLFIQGMPHFKLTVQWKEGKDNDSDADCG